MPDQAEICAIWAGLILCLAEEGIIPTAAPHEDSPLKREEPLCWPVVVLIDICFPVLREEDAGRTVRKTVTLLNCGTKNPRRHRVIDEFFKHLAGSSAR